MNILVHSRSTDVYQKIRPSISQVPCKGLNNQITKPFVDIKQSNNDVALLMF